MTAGYGDDNTVIVKGNNSRGVAGAGDRNSIRVRGDDNTATVHNGSNNTITVSCNDQTASISKQTTSLRAAPEPAATVSPRLDGGS